MHSLDGPDCAKPPNRRCSYAAQGACIDSRRGSSLHHCGTGVCRSGLRTGQQQQGTARPGCPLPPAGADGRLPRLQVVAQNRRGPSRVCDPSVPAGPPRRPSSRPFGRRRFPPPLPRDTGLVMSQENVEVVRRMFQRWNAGDVEGWLHCWHTDAEWISEPCGAFAGHASTA